MLRSTTLRLLPLLLAAAFLAGCANGASTGAAPPLACGSNATMLTTPAFIAAQSGYSPNADADEPINYSANNGIASYGNLGSVPIAAIGGFMAGEMNNMGMDIAEWYLPSDVQSLITSLAYDYPVELSPVLYANNSREVQEQNNNYPTDEASLDIDALLSFCPQCRSGLFGPSNFTAADAEFLSVFVDILNNDEGQRPLVVSASYAYDCDTDSCLGDGVTEYYDSVFQSLAALGVSVVISSGDDGTNGAGNPTCTYAPQQPVGMSSSPSYPSSSPYITSVGATDFLGGLTSANMATYFKPTDGTATSLCGTCPNNPTWTSFCQVGKAAPEQAVAIVQPAGASIASGYTSGGGFSGYAAVPSYQAAVVQAYLNKQCTAANNCKLPANSALYNPNNRGYPDVSMHGGTTYPIGLQGSVVQVGGTSLSAPAFAAVIGHIVQAALAIDGKGLGFLNPTLYKISAATANSASPAFTDITIGDGVCPRYVGLAGSPCYSICQGFYTAPGWDPVTGLGSPYLPSLKAAYLKTIAVPKKSSSSTAAAPIKHLSSSTSAPAGSKPSSTAAPVKHSSSSTAAPSSHVSSSTSAPVRGGVSSTSAPVKGGVSSTSAPVRGVSSSAAAPSGTVLTVCSYTLHFTCGEAGTNNETIVGYLSYNPAQTVANSAYPSYPAGYQLLSLNGTRVVNFCNYSLTSSIQALSPVSKPGTTQSAQGATYTNLFYPAAPAHIDNQGWEFSVSNATGTSYVKVVAGANNPNVTGNIADQSLTYPPAGHTTRGTKGAFSKLSCKNVTQH